MKYETKPHKTEYKNLTVTFITKILISAMILSFIALSGAKTKTAGAATLASNIKVPATMIKKQTVKNIKLKKGSEVTIKKVRKKSGKLTYKIYFAKKNKTYSDYVNTSLVAIKKGLYQGYVLEKTDVSKKAAGKKSGRVSAGKKIKIIKEKTVNKVKWFYIRYKKSKKTQKGWVMADKVMFKTGNSDKKATATSKPSVLSDAQFETEMTKQGFPESYKPGLRVLHEKYPTWQFYGYKTNLDWNTAVDKESELGKSLVPNTRITAWKSSEPGAYDPVNDKYIIYDGTLWVCASRKAVAYYMDPRNFLDATYIFMFEALGYESSYQTTEGVAAVLKGTLFGNNATYSYKDDKGNNTTKTYAGTFVEAASITGVNPVHLASRVKQEVVTGPTSVSNSVTGTVKGYEGIYNFYNIGANDSATGQAVINGLKFASKGTTYMRPWDNRYKAIVGGAKYIGENYINKGQNTIYLERFNVTPKSTYDHQYMTNVVAAYSEAAKNATAYTGMLDNPFVFYIPIYENMPETASPIPSGNLSPNNYLKTLTVTGGTSAAAYTGKPAFAAGNDGSKELVYSIPASEGKVVIAATAINQYATVSIKPETEGQASKVTTASGQDNSGTKQSAAGTIEIKEAVQKFTVKVKAQDGTTRKYTVTINRT